jgi:hypothetical protein
MLKKTLLILLILSASYRLAIAQDFDYGLVTPDELVMKKYVKDTAAHAVVLHEFGRSRINVTNGGEVRLLYEYHVKIKIFDAKAFDEGTIQIPVYFADNNSFEIADGITGVTTYLDDNGQVKKIELEDKRIYPVKENKHWSNYKFALPGLRNGCIIEYKYSIESPFWQNFHNWHFQSDLPKVYSEYDVHIPGFWVYNASIKGPLKLTENTSELERKCFESGGASCDCSHMVYGMKDIPAFIPEDFMTSPKNFLSAINFELSEFTNPYTGGKTVYTKEWKDIDAELKSDPDFGGQLKRKQLFKDRIVTVTTGKTDDLSKARAIYAYVQKWFKWNKFTGIMSVDGISKALDTHAGSIADINLSLITALNAAGFGAVPVLLSTRENGVINPLYPVLTDFDYVVAKVDVGGQSYLLDATDPLLPFGMLPLKCLNDKGRVITTDKPSYWMDLNLPQKEKKTYTLDFTLQDDGKLKGTLTNYSGGYEAYTKRVAIKKFNSTDEYVENLNSKLPKLKIIKAEITNLDSLDLPLSEKYEVEIDLYDKLNGGRLTFNPYILDQMTTNPFKLADRSYPVDMGMPSDERFILTMKLPEQYMIEQAPQDIQISLPNKGGQFLTRYEPGNNSFIFSHVVQLNKSIYNNNEYPYLKELYNKIILSEKAEMVFRKK